MRGLQHCVIAKALFVSRYKSTLLWGGGWGGGGRGLYDALLRAKELVKRKLAFS